MKSGLPLLAGVALALSGCGGGGGSSSPAGNASQISFKSPAWISVSEAASGPFITLKAVPANNRAVTYSIAGGPDAAHFTITADGQLAFRQANFDMFEDADANNVYVVKIRAVAGSASAEHELSVVLENSTEGVAVRQVGASFGPDPVIAPYNKGPGFIVAERTGQLWLVDADTGARTDFGQVFLPGEIGAIMSVVFYRDAIIAIIESPFRGAYLQVVPPPGPTFYSRMQVDIEPGLIYPAQAASLFTGWSAAFGSDTALYLAVGDSQGGRTRYAPSPYGKLLRLDLTQCGASAYGHCLDFTILGNGIRAPAGGGTYQGKLFLFDAAGAGEHEVTSFDPEAPLLDFGSTHWAGTVSQVSNPIDPVTMPSIVYPSGIRFREGTSIKGGAIYAGENPSLKGKLVFGDRSGDIWAAPASFLLDGAVHRTGELEIRTLDFKPDTGTLDSPAAIVTDSTGQMAIMNSEGLLFIVDAG